MLQRTIGITVYSFERFIKASIMIPKLDEYMRAMICIYQVSKKQMHSLHKPDSKNTRFGVNVVQGTAL